MEKKLYRVKDLSHILSMGESSIWKLVADPKNKFPKPIKITKRLTAWLAADIDHWIKEHANKISKNGGDK